MPDGVLLNIDRDLQRLMKEASKNGNSELVRELTLAMIMNRIASNVYAAICFLTVKEDDSRRRKNFVLVTPPLNRQIMDLLFSLVYIRDDFSERALRYERASYRALKEEYLLHRDRYEGFVDWKPFLADMKRALQEMARTLKITHAEKLKLERIPRWLGPSKLSKKISASSAFLKWMIKWVYDDTSAEAHLTGVGLFSLAPFVLAELADPQMKQMVENRTYFQYHARHFFKNHYDRFGDCN